MMARPLYWTEHAPSRIPNDAHRGLWFDKFCGGWSDTWTLGEGKAEWLKTVSGMSGDAQTLTNATLRVIALVEARRGRWGVFATASRFVTGLGLANPAENGFLWHPTLGVPYLPGSSVKGAVGASKNLAESLLGDSDSAGSVAFLDAIPPKPVRTEVDVLTPHYAGWTPQDPPGDWRSPVPIPFLTVASDQQFLFAVIPTGYARDADSASAEIELAWSELMETIEFEGVGAKTAVGYGAFTPDDKATERLERTVLQADADADPDSPRAIAHRLATVPEDEIMKQVREIIGGTPQDGIEAPSPHHLAQVLADGAFLAAWCSSWESKGKKGLRSAESFLASWRIGQTVDPDTHIGSKKLKQLADQFDHLDSVDSS